MPQPQTIENPGLLQAMQTMRENDIPEVRNTLINEFIKAQLLTPAAINPPPVPSADGKMQIDPKAQVTFQMLKRPDGKIFFSAFTSREELLKGNNEGKAPQAVLARFLNYAVLLSRPDTKVEGVVIDPFSPHCTVLPRDLILEVKQRLDQQIAIMQMPKDADIKDPVTWPDEMANALSAAAKQRGDVNALFLRLLSHKDKKHFLVVVDPKEGADAKKMVQELIQVAQPLAGTLPVAGTEITTEIGRRAVKGAKPFYKKSMFYKIPKLD